jgi:hypothetical protein
VGNFLTSWVTVGCSRRILLHGVSWLVSSIYRKKTPNIKFIRRETSKLLRVQCEVTLPRNFKPIIAVIIKRLLPHLSESSSCLMVCNLIRLEPGQLSGITLGYGLDDRGFESRQGMGIFLFTTASRPALGPAIQWVPGLIPWGWSGRGMTLTTHLHLVPKSRMRGAIPPLP